MIVGIQDEILKIHSIGLLRHLLADKTTNSNILWATDAYRDKGIEYQRDKEITVDLITGSNSGVIKNRARKAMEQQSERTRQRGEVFTPLWICQKMNDFADEVWFGQGDVFIKDGQPTDHVAFPEKRKWQQYVDDRRLELTCGEAPYLVSRYDAATGEMIPIANRIGILDRKLRVVNENAADETEWMTWAIRAFQATYGYEFQGDNLLIARVNLLMTFEEYLFSRWKRKPTPKEYQTIVHIIVWNIWQMDGLTGAIPYCKAQEEYRQMSLFEWMDSEEYKEQADKQAPCRIYNWRGKRSLQYREVSAGGRNMKFNFVIGNPPYQDESLGDNKGYAPPIYNKFMDAAYQISEKVELIHPARFLFNAGSTPKTWNEKMLHDSHFKILHYEADASKVFPNTDIKGGVVISYRDSQKDFGAIEHFIVFDELRDIVHKVGKLSKKSLNEIIYAAESYRFTEVMHKENPNVEPLLSKGHKYDLKSNVLSKLDGVIFFSDKPFEDNEYIRPLINDFLRKMAKFRYQ